MTSHAEMDAAIERKGAPAGLIVMGVMVRRWHHRQRPFVLGGAVDSLRMLSLLALCIPDTSATPGQLEAAVLRQPIFQEPYPKHRGPIPSTTPGRLEAALVRQTLFVMREN
jgi:hypothetical protein